MRSVAKPDVCFLILFMYAYCLHVLGTPAFSSENNRIAETLPCSVTVCDIFGLFRTHILRLAEQLNCNWRNMLH